MRKTAKTGSSAERTAALLRKAVVAIALLLPLVVLPGIPQPFSTPKVYLLEGFVAIAWICVAALGLFSRPALPAGLLISLGIWVSAVAASALFGEFVSWESLRLSLSAFGWFLLVTVLRPNAVHIATGMILASAVVAGIALLQYAGLDPFRLLGWTLQDTRPRMRVVATLGNPNFVSALLVSAISLSWPLGRHLGKRGLFTALIVLEAAAVFATGSKAGILAVSTVLLWFSVVVRRGFACRAWIAAGALAVLVMVAFMPSRSLVTATEGRFYIWRVTASHLLEHPFLGSGPGAFEPKFIEWETLHWQSGRGTEAERKFAQLQVHAHNDYLETLVDSGLVGLLGLVSVLLSFLVFAYRHTRRPGSDLVAAASAGVVALAAVALVDFPLHRPAELFSFWTLMAVVYLSPELPTPVPGMKAA
jgi:hypothetical protein